MLTRRDLLVSSAAVTAVGIASLSVQLPPSSIRQPRPTGQLVLFRSSEPEGAQFAQGLHAVRPGVKEHLVRSGAQPSLAAWHALQNLPRGSRVFALLSDRDAMLLESLLDSSNLEQWHRGQHAAAAGTSRHALHSVGFMRDVGGALAAHLQGGTGSYAVAGAGSARFTVEPPFAAAWPTALAMLLGQAGMATAQVTVPAASLQRGCCDAADRRFVSLVLDV